MDIGYLSRGAFIANMYDTHSLEFFQMSFQFSIINSRIFLIC